jgi:hypothetical protein
MGMLRKLNQFTKKLIPVAAERRKLKGIHTHTRTRIITGTAM